MVKKFNMAMMGMILICTLTTGFVAGCKGSDTREKVDDVVEEAAGKKDIERMQKMKQDIDKIEKLHKDRLDQMSPEKE